MEGKKYTLELIPYDGCHKSDMTLLMTLKALKTLHLCRLS